MKFIHTADIHLGALPDSMMPWAQERAGEIWDSFGRLLEEVENSGTDLLMIAGDLFHRQPLKRELKEVNYRFSQLSHAKVLIIAGNHDYIGPQSYYKDFDWAPNVSFFRKNHISFMNLSGMNTLVYGMSYDRADIKEGLFDNLKPMRRFKDNSFVPADYYHILIAHGGDAEHIPMNISKIRKAGFDYVALGHIHKPWLDDSYPIAYCGALEPIDRNDEGEHGYIRGEITEDGTNFEFVPFATRSYETLEINVTEEMTMQEIAQNTSRAIEELGRDNMYKVILSGFRNAELDIDERQIHKYGRILSITDNTIPDFDFEQIYLENMDNIIGMFIKQITEMDMSDELKAKALCYGMKALYQIR